jgi:uncharacterized protein
MGESRQTRLFQRYSDYLASRYGMPVQRVPVDAGFTCPNRNQDGFGGCSYCDGSGSRAPILGSVFSVSEQVKKVAAFNKERYGSTLLLLYLQAFTPTSASVPVLKQVIDEALEVAQFRGLVVSTRPDSLTSDKLDLLESYRSDSFDVELEIGLQSSNDATLQRIRRAHTVSDFSRAMTESRKRHFRVTSHVVFGLPGETDIDMMATISFLSDLTIDGIKIHDLHIPKNSLLAAEILTGELTLLSYEHHLDLCFRALELLPPSTVVERLTCDSPPQSRLLPKRQIDKSRFYRDLEKKMREAGSRQGRLYKQNA